MDREHLERAKAEYRQQYGQDPKVVVLSTVAARDEFRPYHDNADATALGLYRQPTMIAGMECLVSTGVKHDPGFILLPPGLST